jgi:hypothetical protein
MAKTQEEIAEEKELKIRHRFKTDFEFYSALCLKIRPKAGALVPFTMNKAQQYLHLVAQKQELEKGRVRILVLKGRQQGISTYIEGRLYWKVSHRKGVYAFILTHEDKATANLFKMAKRYHDNCLSKLRPVTGSEAAKELNFAQLDSGYGVGTAGTKGVGRSSTPQYFHGSEVAFWPHADTHATGVLQGVPLADGTEIFLESTANGLGNFFHSQWQAAERGESDYIACFLPWYWQPEYTLECTDDFDLTSEEFDLLGQFKRDGLTIEHLVWRRMKVSEFTSSGDDGLWKFRQEYPFTATEAFQTSGEESLINPMGVLAARKAQKPMSGAHVVGVDPARFGKDRTAIIHRNGRKAYGAMTYRKKSTMEVAGICSRILRDPTTGHASDVDMMFIDVGGLGAGVYDRLVELGFEEEGRICAVNSANSPIEGDRYVNKRAEMWCVMRDWFILPGGVDIPDDDALHTDVCGPRYTYDSANRYLIEKKEKMIDRGVSSPDLGDALGLTFAEPVAPPNPQKRMAQQQIREVSYD